MAVRDAEIDQRAVGVEVVGALAVVGVAVVEAQLVDNPRVRVPLGINQIGRRQDKTARKAITIGVDVPVLEMGIPILARAVRNSVR